MELGNLVRQALDLARPYNAQTAANDAVKRYTAIRGQRPQVVYKATAYDSVLPLDTLPGGTILRLDFHSDTEAGVVRAGTNHAWFVCVRSSETSKMNRVFRIHDSNPRGRLGEELTVKKWRLEVVELPANTVPIEHSTTFLLGEAPSGVSPIQIAQMLRGDDTMSRGDSGPSSGDYPDGSDLIRVTVPK